LKGCYQQLRDAEQRIVKVSGVDAEGKPIFEPFVHTASVENKRPKSKGATEY
jgi:hypothetical protein